MRVEGANWLATSMVSVLAWISCGAQNPAAKQPASGSIQTIQSADDNASGISGQAKAAVARDELQQGTRFTRQGRFQEAIPHLLAAKVSINNDYALDFNLSICFVGTGDYKKAIPLLDGLRAEGHENADVENLLAQAYIGTGQRSSALAALERGIAFSQDEKLFTFVADACRDNQDFELGLKVAEIGLSKLPQSARLHYERGMFLAQLDQLDGAREEFGLVRKLAAHSELAYLSGAQENLLAGDVPEAIRIAREGIALGFRNPALLVSLGKALFRSGIVPGEPEFSEAQDALEKAVASRPRDAGSEIVLGQIYLLSYRLDDAIAHLEAARQMMPDQSSIYASLAKAYQRKGDSQRAQDALAKLERLNQAQAERIRSAPGERKMSYRGNSSSSPR